MENKIELEKFPIPQLPPALEEYYKNIPDEEIEFSIGCMDLSIFPLADIRICMHGYRFIKGKDAWKDNAVENDWDKNWILLASYNADPIIADVGSPNVPVKFAYHGEGVWDFEILFNTIGNFNKFVNMLINIHKEDEDFQDYIETYYDSFLELLNKEFDAEEVERILTVFDIENDEDDE